MRVETSPEDWPAEAERITNQREQHDATYLAKVSCVLSFIFPLYCSSMAPCRSAACIDIEQILQRFTNVMIYINVTIIKKVQQLHHVHQN